MKNLLLVVLLTRFISAGYGQEITPKPGIQEKASRQDANAKTQTNKVRAETPSLPNIVAKDNAAPNSAPKDDEKPEAKKERADAELTSFKATHVNAWLTAVLAAIGAVQFLMFRKQLSIMKESNSTAVKAEKAAKVAAEDALKVTHRDHVLSHPPRLNITNVVVWDTSLTENDPPKMIAGYKINGRAYAVNFGRADALIVRCDNNFCYAVWLSEKLPMWRPYNERHYDAKDVFKDRDGKTIEVLKPGEWAVWDFDTVVPDNYGPGVYLYVLGNVFYRDELKTRRARLFARRYNPETESFDIMDKYPDYECEE